MVVVYCAKGWLVVVVGGGVVGGGGGLSTFCLVHL